MLTKKQAKNMKRNAKSGSFQGQHMLIENISPVIEAGLFHAKGIAGKTCVVEADILRDGQDVIRAELKWRKDTELDYKGFPMVNIGPDQWRGEFPLTKLGLYVFTIESWTDLYATWILDFKKRIDAGRKIQSEVVEGLGKIETLIPSATGADQDLLIRSLHAIHQAKDNPKEALSLASEESLVNVMAALQPKEDLYRYPKELKVWADRSVAEFGTWYELFVRSQSTEKGRVGTFKDVEKRLDDIKKMGFDVLYLAPIHPIGKTARKGPNNALRDGPNDPGSPWAIGNESGGHTAIDPALGTIEDFDHLVATAAKNGIEIALDYAIQCSPDHPWVKEHPDWFYRRLDGSIRYAENPPKKYEDIYPLNFDTESREELYQALKDILLYWIGHGVKIFRVDNPHTKPFRFWQWLINEIQTTYPDVVFLSEAFTRPKVMKALAKLGFTQSYTYFTWRNSKWELTEYMNELTTSGMQHYFRPNFFVNTPDILHEVLQRGGRPAFKMRLALAATLSPSYGIYSGFELIENAARQGTEEYLNSEKYEIKWRDWNQPGHIKDYIAKINQIRKENPVFQSLTNIRFFHTDNDNLLFYGKISPDKSDAILVVVNLDPHHIQAGLGWVPLEDIGVRPQGRYQVLDLITRARYDWGHQNFIRLDPLVEPAHILRIEGRY